MFFFFIFVTGFASLNIINSRFNYSKLALLSCCLTFELFWSNAIQITEKKSELAKLESLDCGKPLDEAAWDMVYLLRLKHCLASMSLTYASFSCFPGWCCRLFRVLCRSCWSLGWKTKISSFSTDANVQVPHSERTYRCCWTDYSLVSF